MQSKITSGNKPKENLIKLYPAIFNKIAAKITEPDVGASTCASGNHVCKGHVEFLLQKTRKILATNIFDNLY